MTLGDDLSLAIVSSVKCWTDFANLTEVVEEQKEIDTMLSKPGATVCPNLGRVVENGVLVWTYCRAFVPYEPEVFSLEDARIQWRAGIESIRKRCLGNSGKCAYSSVKHQD